MELLALMFFEWSALKLWLLLLLAVLLLSLLVRREADELLLLFIVIMFDAWLLFSYLLLLVL